MARIGLRASIHFAKNNVAVNYAERNASPSKTKPASKR